MSVKTKAIERHAVSLKDSGNRIEFLDVLRGFALLGIFAMNLPFFAFSAHAYINPQLEGGFDGIHYFTWLFKHLFFDQKMLSIFSMLFGAGTIIFTERQSKKKDRSNALLWRKLFWLFLIGIIHAYIIWEGDILVSYSISAALVYLFRRFSPFWLILISVALFICGMSILSAQGYYFTLTREMHEQEIRLLEQGKSVPENIEALARAWTGVIDKESREILVEGIRETIEPGPELLEEERNAVLGSFLERVRYRAPEVFLYQSLVYLMWILWKLCGLMLLGMALYKLGVLSGTRSRTFYLRMALTCFGLGFFANVLSVLALHFTNFDAALWFLYVGHFNYVSSVLIALGYSACIMLICKSNILTSLRLALGSVGRMSLTNYLLQSLIAAFLFFGWGLGWYSFLQRAELIPLILLVWAFQILFSSFWLKRFCLGPIEWVWRSLTYWKLQPLRQSRALSLSN